MKDIDIDKKTEVSFEYANKLFLKLSRLFEIRKFSKLSLYKRKPFLLLSYLCDRDVYFLEASNLDTVFLLGRLENNLSNELFSSLSKKQRFTYLFSRFISNSRRLKFTEISHLVFNGFKFILKTFLSIIDTLLLLIIAFLYILLLRNTNNSNKRETSILNKELYTIYFWKNKKRKSIEYYYPDYQKRESKVAFATTFYQYRFNSIGLLSAIKYKDIFTALDFLSIGDIFRSIHNLLSIYIFELNSYSKKSFGSLYSLLNSYKHINLRLLSLFNYYSSCKACKLKPSKIFIWHENQLNNRAISIGVNKFYTDSCAHIPMEIYSYFGSYYSSNSLKQFTPTQFELLTGIWGLNNFLHQDNNSLLEMKNALANTQPLCQYTVVRRSLNRHSQRDSKHTIIPNDKKVRYATIFSHIDPNEIYIILFRTCFHSNNNFCQKEEFLNRPIYFRLHPTINRKQAIHQIEIFKREFNFDLLKYYFIDNNLENIKESIQLTRYCIFGNSSYINMAVKSGSKVIAVRTSFLYKPQLHNVNSEDSNIFKIY